jgi:acetyl-CoA carboxylase carboxyltransferase component
MGASQAAKTMLDVQIGTLKREGTPIDDAKLSAMAAELRARYDRETDVRHAAARGWVDAIIDPAETRDVLITAFDVASRQRPSASVPVGVFQV